MKDRGMIRMARTVIYLCGWALWCATPTLLGALEISSSPVATVLAPASPSVPATSATMAAPLTETPAPVAISDQDAIMKHLAALDAKIAQLEKNAGKGIGNGAYRRGTSFLVEGGGSESVLERLRRLEHELAQARGDIQARQATSAELQARLDTEQRRAANLGEKAESLSHVRDSLVAAQQTLVERQGVIDRLQQRQAEIELTRLQSERAYFALAASVLRLESGRGQDLLELQEQVRQQAKVLQPAESARKTNGKATP